MKKFTPGKDAQFEEDLKEQDAGEAHPNPLVIRVADIGAYRCLMSNPHGFWTVESRLDGGEIPAALVDCAYTSRQVLTNALEKEEAR